MNSSILIVVVRTLLTNLDLQTACMGSEATGWQPDPDEMTTRRTMVAHWTLPFSFFTYLSTESL